MLSFVTVALCLCPQGVIERELRGGRLVLPPVQKEEKRVQDPKVTRDQVQERFHRDAMQLRRSQHLPEAKEMALIRRIGEDYNAVPQRALLLLRRADSDLTHGLMRLLRTFGGPTEASELKFQLLTRTFGNATKIVVETMTMLAQDQAREYLFECLTASRAAVRKHVATNLRSLVRVEDSPSLFLQGMGGSLLPVATAHGEGRADFGGGDIPQGGVALRYVDSDGAATEHYPQNPNGSPAGVTGLCNADGRVTIMMPHPERMLRGTNFSWAPAVWRSPAEEGYDPSPWLRMFRNARRWVD